MKRLLMIIVALVATALPANAEKVVLGTPSKTMPVMVEELANGGVRIKPETTPDKVVEAMFDSEVFDYGKAWTDAWAKPGKLITVKGHMETKRLDLTHFMQTPYIDIGMVREGNRVSVVRNKALPSMTLFNPFLAFEYTAGILFLISYLTVWLAKRREYVSKKEAGSIATVFMVTCLLAFISVAVGVLILEAYNLPFELGCVVVTTTLLAAIATILTIVARLAEKKALEISSFSCTLVFSGISIWAYLSL